MAVYSNFERKYKVAPDPWGIADASQYYDALFQFIHKRQPRAKTALDCGCGEGQFTVRLKGICDHAFGVDVSPTAIKRAYEQNPDIQFYAFDLRNITGLGFGQASFDLIVCSQVLYYMSWAEAANLLLDLEMLLARHGVLYVAANCSGGNYFSPEELRALVQDGFDIVAEHTFGHHLFLAAVRRPLEVVLTVDYEVAEHGGKGKASPSIWQRQVLDPCDQLMEVCEEFGARLTIFLEICQYWFVEQNFPEVAERIRKQLREAVRRGHDVQAHMHTRWLPEFGAKVDSATGQIQLNMAVARLHDFPAETIVDLLRRAKCLLESLLRSERDTYRTIVFRAGKYQIQSHQLIFSALAAAGFRADSSVWHGGFVSVYDRNPGFDFRSLWHNWKPYRPSSHDICVPASVTEDVPSVIELPILAGDGEQWALEHHSADELLALWHRWKRGGGPRVMIAHTKGITPKTLNNLRVVLSKLSEEPTVGFKGLQEVAEEWDQRCQGDVYERARAAYALRSSMTPEALWTRSSSYHRRKVERLASIIASRLQEQQEVHVLDVGCGTGELITFPLRYRLREHSNILIRGIDIDPASIARAAETVAIRSLKGISFEAKQVEDVAETFDCIVCCEVVEYLSKPGPFLSALHDRVAKGGLLVLTTPNGYGYKEIERRLFYAAFDLAQKLPVWARTGARGAYRFLRSWLKRRLQARGEASTGGRSQRLIMGTLNFQNDIHIQYFTTRKLVRLLEEAGFVVEEVHNMQVMGGLIGTLLERPLGLDRLLRRMPHALAADWLLVCRPQYDNNSL